MIRFLLRFIACFILAAATVLGVGDVARSLGASALRLMRLDEAAALAAPYMPFPAPQLAGTGADILAWVWAQIAHWPASASLAALAIFIFGATARERRRAPG